MDKGRLTSNYEEVCDRLDRAARRSGRAHEDVRLVAVIKTVGNDAVSALQALGQRRFAENRVQALRKRPQAILEQCEFHLIGHLQTNKVKQAVAGFHWFHGVDSLRLAAKLDQAATERSEPWPILVQVNIAKEPQKYGVDVASVPEMLRAVNELSHLKLCGLMALAPWADTAEASRPWFRRLRETRDELLATDHLPAAATELSMGMSGDFEVAVEEGATMVRVGSALFNGV